ncbi:MAG TPA: SpoIID/LytB domain-containing protein [Vicinamibacterales bacterium]
MRKLVLAGLIAVCGLSQPIALGQALSSADTIRIGVLKNGSYEIVVLPVETYVARVLVGEALPGSEPAALETLAIAIRTYALENRGRHRADGFDLCDQTHCQVMRASTPATERAALATANQVLLYKGQLATVYYSASCGGRTEKPSNVWPGSEDPPYLPSKDDDGCQGFPEWSTELSIADLQRALRAAGFTGMLRNVKIADRNESGRASRIEIEGMTPGEISGQDLRAAIGRTLGWQYLQSASFQLARSGKAFRFAGHGNGHGVGLCVIGSAKLAQNGETARQILERYFPGTTIGTIGPRLTAAPPDRDRPSIAPPPRTAAATPPPSVTQPPAIPAVVPGPSSAKPTTDVPVTTSPSPAGAAAAPSSAVAATDIVISLPEGDEGERAVITSLVRRERDDLARALGVEAPSRLTIRFHPTTDAFERMSGRPWFTLGSTGQNDLQFVPLTVLRDRGILERTIRRQLVHALADAALEGRPAWVRDGAAAYFAEAGDSASSRLACPVDVELTRPLSAGAYGDATRRARACFERQLSSRKDWRAVK